MWVHFLVIFSLMLPIPFPIIAIGIGVIYTLIRYHKALYKTFLSQWFISLFFLITLIGSLIAQNIAGIIVACLIFLLWIYLIGLAQDLSPFLFESATSLWLIASWIHALYALLQHFKILFGPDYHAFHSSMISWRDGRADSVFLNPNYYAFMCVIYIIIALYKLQTSGNKWRYYSTIAINCLGVIFTQSRTALAVIFLVCFVFYYCVLPKKSRKYLSIGGATVVIFSPLLQFLPRFDYGTIVSHLVDIRFEIWQVAIDAFSKKFLLGYGPFAYRLLYPLYGSYPTQHAHNIYIDSLVNYGIIGSALLIFVLIYIVRRLIKQSHHNRPLFALGISLVALVLLHGLLDVSIIFVHTLTIFSFLLIYSLKTNNKSNLT